MKKNLTISKLMMLIVMAVLPFSMYAQEGKKKSTPVERYWYIQADGGLSINHGDLANYEGWVFDDFNHYKSQALKNWNAHFGIGYQFGKVIGMNLKGGYGLLSGHKHQQALVLNGNANQTLWNLGLDKTNYIEGNLNLTFNLFNMFNYNPRRVINFVPHIGIGGIYYKAGAVQQLDADDKVASTLAQPADKRDLSFTVPAGMEITFNIAPKFDLFLDYTYLFTGTDALDQVAKIKSDEDKHVINDKDMYSQFNLGLRVKFNNPCDIEKMARESKKITYRVNPDPLVEGEDGNVCFDVIVNIPGEYFEKQAVMNLKPYLAYNGGQIDIDPITFVGEKVKGQGDFRVNYKEGGEFTKHYCMPYQEEMANSELMADPMFYVYNGTIYPNQDEIVKNTYFTQGATEKLADGVITPNCKPATNVKAELNENTVNLTWSGEADSYDVILMKDNEVVKTVNVKGTNQSFDGLELGAKYSVNVVAKCTDKDAVPASTTFTVPAPPVEPDFIYYFDYNKSNILGAGKDVRNRNKIARKQVKEMVTGDVKGLRIEGWASPEGELGLNNNLSDDRSNAAIADIKAQLKKNAGNIEYNGKGNGPDWNKFMSLVENSNLKDKDAILNNIRNSSNRERTIKEMIAIYPQLEKEILPLIRRAEVYIIK